MNKDNPENDGPQHQSKRKERFKEFKDWLKSHWRALWEDIEKETRTVKFWFEVGATLILIAYTTAAFLQWRAQINAMKNDERAWFDVDGAFAPQVKEGDVLGTNIRIRNKGRTAGKKLLSEWVVSVYKSSDTIPFDYSNSHEVTKEIIGVIYPDDSSIFPITKPPGEKVETFTKDDVESLTKGKAYIAAYGRGLYFDVFNKPHWFHFCNWKYYGVGGEYQALGCTIYTDTGDGQVPDSDVKK